MYKLGNKHNRAGRYPTRARTARYKGSADFSSKVSGEQEMMVVILPR